MEESTSLLESQKDLLNDQKQSVDEATEDLNKQVMAREEANTKRLMAKLARDKNPNVKAI